MRSEEMVALIRILQLHLFTIIFITLSTTNGTYEEEDNSDAYETCSSLVSCGKVQNVGYPFWGSGRPRYCGHPALELICPPNNSGDQPILKIHTPDDDDDVSFRVLNISTCFNKTTIKLALQESRSDAPCPDQLFNPTFHVIFQFSHSEKSIKLVYDCTPIQKKGNISDSITCSSRRQPITAYYLPNMSDHHRGSNCKSFHVPVLKDEVDSLAGGNKTLSNVLKLGFEVEYNAHYSEFCSQCESFGRSCGSFSDTNFVCFRDGKSGYGNLNWTIRMKIATETACALSYLHASDIIHRDVKTNNILLDDNFSVKVADFGLSRLFPFDATHVSTAPQGTPGYLDPEYHKCYQVTNKSDVYSFGVVLVELISSLPAIDISRQEDEINLSDYAMNRIQHGRLDELVDRKLGFESDFKVKRMITLVAELAFQCLQQEKEVRPSMEELHEALKRIESVDYEALQAAETNQTKTSTAAENDVKPSLTNAQHPPSPSSVIDNWASRSIASNTSG